MVNKDLNQVRFKRQQHLSLTDIAYQALLEAIINQDLKPGAPISIDSLAKQLDMSNTPVRESLMRAHGQRLVTQKTNHGFLVSDILTSDEVKQLFDARHLLEVYALSVASMTADVVDAASSILDQMTTSADGTVYIDYREYMVLDHQFHRILVGLSQNEFLIGAWEDLHVHLHLSRLYTGVGLFDRNESTKEHQAIVEALRQGNPKAAADLLSQHIRHVEKRIQVFLSK